MRIRKLARPAMGTATVVAMTCALAGLGPNGLGRGTGLQGLDRQRTTGQRPRRPGRGLGLRRLDAGGTRHAALDRRFVLDELCHPQRDHGEQHGCDPASDIWAVGAIDDGDSHIPAVALHWDGTSWTPARTPPPSPARPSTSSKPPAWTRTANPAPSGNHPCSWRPGCPPQPGPPGLRDPAAVHGSRVSLWPGDRSSAGSVGLRV